MTLTVQITLLEIIENKFILTCYLEVAKLRGNYLCIKDLQSDYDPCNIQYLSGPQVLYIVYNGIITFILAACSNIELSSALTRWMANILEQYKVAANWRGLLMWSPFICINEVSTLTRCVCEICVIV